MFAALCENYEFFQPKILALVMIAPVVRCKNQMVKESSLSIWLGDKMLEIFKRDGPEVLNIVTCINRYEMDNHYSKNKAIDDESVAMSSDINP